MRGAPLGYTRPMSVEPSLPAAALAERAREKLRAVFVMRELEGLSTEETAEALDVSIDVVKVRLHRARLQLRERLSRYFTELAQAEV